MSEPSSEALEPGGIPLRYRSVSSPCARHGEGDAPDSFGAEDVEEAVFDPAVEHRVRRLVDEQWGAEPAEDGDGLGGALVGVGGDADIEGFAGGDGGVEGAEGLLEGGLGVVVVVVEDVDVVERRGGAGSGRGWRGGICESRGRRRGPATCPSRPWWR